MKELLQRLERREEEPAPVEAEPICRGTLLSRQQYLHETNELGYRDARDLGATRLSGALDQLRPILAVHGHTHRGALRGTTRGVPVFNVALPVLRRLEKPLGYLTLDL